MRQIKTMLQKMVSTKRITVLIVVLAFVVSSVITLIPPTPPVAAWGTSAPDAGVMRLRIGKDGRTTHIPLKVYYTSPQTNPIIRFYQAPRDYAGEDEHSCAGNGTVNIMVNGQQWDCDERNRDNFGYHQVTLPSTGSSHAPGLPGYYLSDATIQLVGNLHPGCEDDKNSNGDEDDADEGCVDYKFTAQLINAPSGSLLTMDESTNPNGYDLWGANRYSIPFGPPPSACGRSSVPGTIGLYDPDGERVSLTLYQYNRNAGRWDTIATHRTGTGGERAFTWNHNFVPGEKYVLTVSDLKKGNTVVPYFPFPTIYGEVSVTCWNVATSSSVTANPAGPGSTPTAAKVVVDPDNPAPASVTWTHTADNQGIINTAPLDLSYRWSTTPPTGSPNPPIAPLNNIVISPSVDRIRASTITIPADTPPGTRYCQGMRASRTSFQNSAPTPWTSACVTVVWPETKPYFQVFGGDVDAISSLCNGAAGRPTCSIRGWPGSPLSGDGARGQIAALARGTIAGFPNANGVAGGHKLSFAHPSAGGAGNFCTTCYDPGSLPTTTESGNQTVSGYDPNKYIRLVNGNIYIDRNIDNPSTFGLDNLKFTRLVATGNIYIHPNVTNIDAVLQAGGNIYTCAFGFAAPSAQQIARECRRKPPTWTSRVEPLRINGAISARYIKLFRSSGDLNQPNPAETINYVPMAWLQAISGAGLGGLSGTYDAYTSLPPVL